MERKLGRRVITSTKNSRPFYKTIWDYVYDIPLIQSLQQLLSDSMILGEVHIDCISFCLVHVHVLCISHNYVHVYKLCWNNFAFLIHVHVQMLYVHVGTS